MYTLDINLSPGVYNIKSYIHFNKNIAVSLNNLLVCIVWILGLVCGALVASRAGISLYAFVYTIPEGHLTLFAAIATKVCPVIITAALCRISHSLILPIVWLKAFSYSYCIYCLNFAFSGAGWLVCLLLLFSEFLVIINLLCFLILNYLKGSVSFFNKLIIHVSISIGVGLFDYYLISPYVAVLFNTR